MFIDYYSILGIEQSANLIEIKAAFKTQALKWHPDKNPNENTTQRMQEINEAYLILKDNEARELYDKEYIRFKQSHDNFQRNKAQDNSRQRDYHQHESYYYSDFDINDDLLKKWMNNASIQAVDLAKKTIEELRELMKVGAKAAGKEMGRSFITYTIIGVLFTLIIFLSKYGCK